MNTYYPLPFFTFLKLVFQNGGIHFNKLKNTTPWLIKTLLFEPFRWLELAKYNKQIRAHRMQRNPIFILGYYRSGTSYLHQCLIQDDRFGYHTNYQMVLPEVMLTTEKVMRPAFDWICRKLNITDSVHRVPLSFLFPGEEDATMTTYLDPKGAQWGYFFPGKMMDQFRKYVLFEGITESEKLEWEASFKYLLNKISIANRGKQLVLKSPPHTARIRQLLRIYPEAKFIFIHRNPYSVYSSNKKFWNVLQKVYALQGTRAIDVNSVILDTYAMMMQRYLDEKAFIPAGQLSELAYDVFIQNPVESLAAVYRQLDLGDFNYCKERMKAFTGEQRQFIQLRHSLPESESNMVSGKLEKFIRHWGYDLL